MEIIDISNSIQNTKSKNKYKIIFIEGIAWLGSGLVLTAYILPLDAEIDFFFMSLGRQLY